MSTLRRRTISGLKWSGTSQVLTQALQFGVSVLLARLLAPSDFGLMAMIAFFTGFANTVAELGLGAALIQRQALEERHISTIFWVNVATGLLLALLMVLGAPLIARFYDEPALRPLATAISLGFVINGLRVVQRNLLMRSMEFRRLFRVDLTALLVAGATAVAAALLGAGVWTLVVQQLVLSVMTALLLWLASPWRPHWLFDWAALRQVWGFSANLLGFNILNYGNRNLDNLMIGRFIGSQALGYYARAYSLMLLPIVEVTSVFTRVMFPALASIQDDKTGVKRIYLQATRTIALVTFPLMIGLMVVAEPFVITLLGETWRPIIPVLQVLSLTGLTQSVSTTVGWIFTSQGRTDVLLKWGIYSLAVLAVTFAVGLRWGILGVAVAYVISGLLLLTLPGWYVAGRLIDLSLGEILGNLTSILLCALAMGAGVWGLSLLLPLLWPAPVRLFVLAAAGAGVYLLLLHLFGLRAYRETRTLLLKELRLPASLSLHLPRR